MELHIVSAKIALLELEKETGVIWCSCILVPSLQLPERGLERSRDICSWTQHPGLQMWVCVLPARWHKSCCTFLLTLLLFKTHRTPQAWGRFLGCIVYGNTWTLLFERKAALEQETWMALDVGNGSVCFYKHTKSLLTRIPTCCSQCRFHFSYNL